MGYFFIKHPHPQFSLFTCSISSIKVDISDKSRSLWGKYFLYHWPYRWYPFSNHRLTFSSRCLRHSSNVCQAAPTIHTLIILYLDIDFWPLTAGIGANYLEHPHEYVLSFYKPYQVLIHILFISVLKLFMLAPFWSLNFFQCLNFGQVFATGQ